MNGNFLYFLLVPPLLLLALPLLLSLRVCRTAPTSPISVEIRFGIYRALTGISLSITGSQRFLYILFLSRKLPIPSFDLSPKKKTPPEKSSSKTRSEKKTEQSTEPPSPKSEQSRNTLLLLRSLAKPLLDFLIRFPRVFWLNELMVKGRFGFANPLQTGNLYGLQQVLQILPFKRFSFDLTPDFCTQGTCGQARLTLHIHLGLIIVLCIRLAVRAGLRYLAMRFRFRIARFI